MASQEEEGGFDGYLAAETPVTVAELSTGMQRTLASYSAILSVGRL